MAEPQILAESKSGRVPAFPWRAFVMLLASFLVMIVVAGGVEYRQQRLWEDILQQEITRNLMQKAQMLAGRINSDHSQPITSIVHEAGQAAGARVTVIDGARNVMADSENQVASLEGEADRPEFTSALRGSVASEIRKLNGVSVVYVAVPVHGGAVRLAYPLSDTEIAASQATNTLWLTCGIAALIALVISALASIILRTA